MNPELLKETIRTFLEKLGATVTSVVVVTSKLPEVEDSRGGRVVVAVTSPHSKELIGPGGEHLRVINVLVRRLVEQKYGEESSSFLVDINGYHETQMEKIRGNARMLAQRARLFKHDVEMEPMSSYERLVIHELFAHDTQIKTVSEGEGKFRHIVLKVR